MEVYYDSWTPITFLSLILACVAVGLKKIGIGYGLKINVQMWICVLVKSNKS